MLVGISWQIYSQICVLRQKASFPKCYLVTIMEDHSVDKLQNKSNNRRPRGSAMCVSGKMCTYSKYGKGNFMTKSPRCGIDFPKAMEQQYG